MVAMIGGERAEPGDAGEDVVAPGELFVGGDDGRDLGVQRGDLFEALAALPLEQRDGEVLECGAIADQSVAGVDEFGQLVLLRAASRPDRRLQRDRHAGEQPDVDTIGLGKRAGRLIGDPFGLPLPGPYDQRLVPLGGVGELAIDPGRMGMAAQCRFGDVDADGLW
jgi:hypothetical protein